MSLCLEYFQCGLFKRRLTEPLEALSEMLMRFFVQKIAVGIVYDPAREGQGKGWKPKINSEIYCGLLVTYPGN